MAGGTPTPTAPPSSLLTSQLATMAFVLVTVQVLKKFDLEDPTTKFYVRCLYVSAQLLMAASYYYIYTCIKKNKGAWWAIERGDREMERDRTLQMWK